MPSVRPTEAGLAIRILADDLTGALDAAGPFAARCGRFRVYWDSTKAAADTGSCVALDTGTREADVATAVARNRDAARSLWTGHRGLAFKKVDSVWRGNPAAEIAAASSEGRFELIIVAPSFPEQGRVTRDGAQWVADGRHWRCVVPDIAAELRGFGVDAVAEAHASATTHAIVCDATLHRELDAIVALHAQRATRTLWCGTGGLARALAAHFGSASVNTPGCAEPLATEAPALVVVGTDHPVSQAQACEFERHPGVHCRTVDCTAGVTLTSGAKYHQATSILLRFRIPPGTARNVAQSLIEQAFAHETKRMSPPRLVLATGGETLRAMSDTLGATRLDVLGEREPGIPCATWSDGRWARTPLLSKSGGFGSEDLFVKLIPSTKTHVTRNSR